MAERPILFGGEMVRAILDGRKTQTRRVVKFPRHTYEPTVDWVASVNPDGNDGWIAWGPHKMTDEGSRKAYPDGGGFKCPYGVTGDLLWVRETHVFVAEVFGLRPGIAYQADNQIKWVDTKTMPDGATVYNAEKPDFWQWRPSIHMPRWASRITLRVTDVRVERVQDISEEDAKAEGVMPLPSPVSSPESHWRGLRYIPAFAALWNDINTTRGYSWEVNPWVWVVEFERVTP